MQRLKRLANCWPPAAQCEVREGGWSRTMKGALRAKGISRAAAAGMEIVAVEVKDHHAGMAQLLEQPIEPRRGRQVS